MGTILTYMMRGDGFQTPKLFGEADHFRRLLTMSRVDLTELQRVVTDIAQHSALGSRLRHVLFESDEESDARDFFRVIIQVDNLDDLNEKAIDELTDSIENYVLSIDNRFPSVRFAEAV